MVKNKVEKGMMNLKALSVTEIKSLIIEELKKEDLLVWKVGLLVEELRHRCPE